MDDSISKMAVRRSAVLTVLENRMSIREAAEAYGFKKSTLMDMVKKVRVSIVDETSIKKDVVDSTVFNSPGEHTMVFTFQQEESLKKYVLRVSKTDTSFVMQEELQLVLPLPQFDKNGYAYFPVDFSSYNL
jgi:hypothetical protein